MSNHWTHLTPHLAIFHGPGNTGVLHDGSRAVLIDAGDGAVVPYLAELGVKTVAMALFTHHHRDTAGAAEILAGGGTGVVVPAGERQWFEEVTAFWNDPAYRWHLYNYRPSHLMLTAPVRVDRALADGDTLDWGPARITALATPGHTDGGMSYIVEVDGHRVSFSGDLLYDAGQCWELHSLQKGVVTDWDYHGFLGAREAWSASLRRVLTEQPDCLAPSHGRLMADPPTAVRLTEERLSAIYANYLAASTVRSYFPQSFPHPADALPIHPELPVPDCLRHIGTTWVLISRTGAAFVMDCGDPWVIEELQRWQAAGEITSVEGIWITHYHDDHVNAVPAFQRAFDCPLYADATVAETIAEPSAWRLPCQSPDTARVDHVTGDGERWTWHEYAFTAYHFPGQSLHHGGLLVEGDGPSMFFVGDSFALAGLDDYCAQNRNFLGDGVGYQRCLALLQNLHPDLLFNPHVDGAFAFTPEDYRFLRENLTRREALIAELVPWDHPNFALDDAWARCHPYEQPVVPGQLVHFEVVITNHAAVPCEVICRAALPAGWETGQAVTAVIPARAEGRLALEVTLPANLPPGRHPLAVDITFAGRHLPQFTETVLVRGEK